jgi:hypothetical protein
MIGVQQSALGEADAAEVPGGMDDLLEELVFEDAGGPELGAVLLTEFLEGSAVFVRDGDVGGTEAVLDGVLIWSDLVKGLF